MGVSFSFSRFYNALFIFFILLIIIFPTYGNAQIILTEVMFDADTLESHNEFVEIYNLSENPVNLTGWRIGDSTEVDLILGVDTQPIIQPNHYAIILDASYFENSQFVLFESQAHLLLVGF